jgi:hypothetical protein
LVERFSTLAAVARDATRDDIGPVGQTAQSARNNMVIGQFVQWRSLPAVLTLITITGVNMLPGKFDTSRTHTNELEEANNRWEADGETDTMNLSGILLYDFNLA